MTINSIKVAFVSNQAHAFSPSFILIACITLIIFFRLKTNESLLKNKLSYELSEMNYLSKKIEKTSIVMDKVYAWIVKEKGK